jgi:hypothetical protein
MFGRILREHGCTFVRQGKGDQEIWYSPLSKRNVTVDRSIKSRHSIVSKVTADDKFLTTRRRTRPIDP